MCALAAAPGALGNAGGLRMALPLAVALVRPCKAAQCKLASGLARCTRLGLTQPLHARARQQRHAEQRRQQCQHSRPSRLTSAAAALLCVHRPLHGLVVRRLRGPQPRPAAQNSSLSMQLRQQPREFLGPSWKGHHGSASKMTVYRSLLSEVLCQGRAQQHGMLATSAGQFQPGCWRD